MKFKINVIISCLLAIIFFVSTNIYASGIVNRPSFSAEYIRTFSRNASTDAPDIITTNPAGIMKMETGSYLSINVFEALGDSHHYMDGKKFDSDTASTIPSLFGIYKKENWAVYAAVNIFAATGAVKYTEGASTTQAIGSGPIEAVGYTIGYTFGSSYKINEVFSAAISLRYASAFSGAEASGELLSNPLAFEYEKTATGLGVALGINIAPTNKLNMAFRYETRIRQNYETEIKKFEAPDHLSGILGAFGITDGGKERKDLPATIGFGVSYHFNPDFKASLSYNYYLEKQANLNGLEKKIDNSYDLGVSLEKTFSRKLMASLGFIIMDLGIKPDDVRPEAPELDLKGISSGVAYNVNPHLTLNMGGVKYFAESVTSSDNIKIGGNAYGVVVGFVYKWN